MHELRYSPEFEKDFAKLKAKTLRGDGEARYLLGLIEKATTKLAENREAGKKIPRKLWPLEYVRKYDVTNLWKLSLDSYWRLIYTLLGDQVNLFLICLEWMDYKEYDRKFKYR